MQKAKKILKKKDPEIYLKQLGERLKALRIKSGYTNYEYFAYENNLGRSQYGKYETGGNIRFDTLVKIVQIHGLTLEEFFSEGFED